MASVPCVLVGNLMLSHRSNMSDIFLLGCNQRRQEFGLLSTSTQQSEFSVVPIGNKYTRISSSFQKKGGHHKFWMDSGVISNLHTWPFAIRLSTVRSFERCWWGRHYANDGAVQKAVLQWLQMKESKQFVGMNMCSCSKVKNKHQQRWIRHWKITLL